MALIWTSIQMQFPPPQQTNASIEKGGKQNLAAPLKKRAVIWDVRTKNCRLGWGKCIFVYPLKIGDILKRSIQGIFTDDSILYQ